MCKFVRGIFQQRSSQFNGNAQNKGSLDYNKSSSPFGGVISDSGPFRFDQQCVETFRRQFAKMIQNMSEIGDPTE